MPVTEIQRTNLANRLTKAIGEENTETLMQSLLPEGRDQLATKAELKATKAELKTEIAEVKAELKTEIAEVKAELKTEIAEVKTQIAELRADIFEQFFKLTRYFTFLVVGLMASTWATMIPLILAT